MPGLEDLRNKLGKGQPEPPKTVATPPVSSTPRQPRKPNQYKAFITTYSDTLIKALYNARNTIRGKKEVQEKDESKQYYRDFLKYEEIIEKLKKLV